MKTITLALFLTSTCLFAGDCGCKKKSSDSEAKKQTADTTPSTPKSRTATK